jgi:hypothetical protein
MRITVLTTTHHSSLSLGTRIQPHNFLFKIHFNIMFPFISESLEWGTFRFPDQNIVSISPWLPCVIYAPTISSSLIWSLYQFLTKSTNYKVPHCAFFFILLLLPLFQVQEQNVSFKTQPRLLQMNPFRYKRIKPWQYWILAAIYRCCTWCTAWNRYGRNLSCFVTRWALVTDKHLLYPEICQSVGVLLFYSVLPCQDTHC